MGTLLIARPRQVILTPSRTRQPRHVPRVLVRFRVRELIRAAVLIRTHDPIAHTLHVLAPVRQPGDIESVAPRIGPLGDLLGCLRIILDRVIVESGLPHTLGCEAL
jgi:hypothetical protein